MITPELQARFHSYVWKNRGPNACWTWDGRKSWHGYGLFYIQVRNPRIEVMAHRLAWELANNRKIPAGMLICHHCDNPACVNPAHLFLGTHADNTADMLAKGRHRAIARSKLTPTQVIAIRNDPRRQTVIAKEYGVDNTTIRAIITGKSWKHLPLGPIASKRQPRRGGEHGNAKLTDEIVLAIRSHPGTNVAIAQEYGLHPVYVSKIRGRKVWKHI